MGRARGARAALAVLPATIVLAGCGGDGSEPEAEPTTSTTATAEVSDAEEPDAVASEPDGAAPQSETSEETRALCEEIVPTSDVAEILGKPVVLYGLSHGEAEELFGDAYGELPPWEVLCTYDEPGRDFTEVTTGGSPTVVYLFGLGTDDPAVHDDFGGGDDAPLFEIGGFPASADDGGSYSYLLVAAPTRSIRVEVNVEAEADASGAEIISRDGDPAALSRAIAEAAVDYLP